MLYETLKKHKDNSDLVPGLKFSIFSKRQVRKQVHILQRTAQGAT